jgi:hypothetical protein
MSFTDRAATRARKFEDPKSRLMRDGREALKGQDWIARKLELWARSGGRCEHTWKVGRQTFRCSAEGTIPAHVIPRHPLRDDRMENLLCLCMTHDQQTEKQSWRKTRFGERTNA